MENEIIVGLDIGTTKVCAIVGRRNEYGKVEILGMGKSESVGVNRGVVANIDRTVGSIKKAIEIASEKSGVDISEVHVGIAGQHIKSLQHCGQKIRDSYESEIRQIEIDDVINNMYRLAMKPGEEIIHVIPQDFIIDDEQGILEPIGMAGSKLEVNCHIITGLISAAKNIKRCVVNAALQPTDLILEPLASAESVLAAEEKEAGIALVDIGGGTTDIAIFQGGIIRHTAVIPFGGNIITEDIMKGCSILKHQAELLKTKFGSAMASEAQSNEIVSIPGLRGRSPKEISLKNLASIIEARMTEIIDNVDYEIRNSGVAENLIGGIVITGGGAMLTNCQQLVEFVTGLDTRIGYPNEHLGKSIDELKSPMYATGIGLVLMGINEVERKKRAAEQGQLVRAEKRKGGWFDHILKKGKKILESDGDDAVL